MKQAHRALFGAALITIEGDGVSVFPQLRKLNGPDWWAGLQSAADPCWLSYVYHTGQSSWAFRFGFLRFGVDLIFRMGSSCPCPKEAT